MSDIRQLEQGKDWTINGDVISGKGDANAVFRGLQADLNFFGEKCKFSPVKVDGKIGPQTMAAMRAVNDAVIAKNPMLAGTVVPPRSVNDVATFAMMTRKWLETTARDVLAVGNLRRYHQGSGKEWNIKGDIAYGAGPVHEDFKGLQNDLNRFAGSAGFGKLSVDGFLGAKTATAVKAVYDAAVRKNPMLAVTLFPPPDTKEEAAEFCMFIRAWLRDVAGKQLLGEA